MVGSINGSGIISASGLNPELQGELIDDVVSDDYIGTFFVMTADYTFGGITFNTGYWCLANGGTSQPWSDVPNTDAVTSINGMLGNVILTAEEIPFGAESDVDEELKRLETDKADKDNVLELDNTTAYTPTADYHPCTKAYTDSGLATKADVASLSSNNIGNDSEVEGEDVTDALNTLKNETDEVLNFTPTNYTPTGQTLKGYFEGLDDGLENYTKTYTTMPTASADNLGETIQYLQVQLHFQVLL